MRKKTMTLIRACMLLAIGAICMTPTKEATARTPQQTLTNDTLVTTLNATESDSVAMPTEDASEQFAHDLDAMVSSLLAQNNYAIDTTSFVDSLGIFFIDGFNEPYDSELVRGVLPDSVYIRRLQGLESVIDLPYNETVQSVITMYTERKRKNVETMLGLAAYYFPMFEETFDKYGIPLELKYMAVIESALNPSARSRAGAMGLWQFMYGTGKLYGLEVSSYVDERRDPIKATDAAARYLKTLYNIYGDWHLVIAAYNCGPGNVNKAISRAGGKRDYWSIYYRLPKETRTYVPAFIAASYVMNYYKHHNLTPKKVTFPIVTDTIMISDYLNLKQVSEYMGLDLQTLRELNPMYRVDVIPARPEKPYPLCLPQEYVMGFLSNQDSVLAFNRNSYFPNNTIKTPTSSNSNNNLAARTPTNIEGRDKVLYTVKQGDNPGFIAQWFDVKLSDLKYWNNMRNNMIRVGQKLVIYVPEGKGDYYLAFNNLTFEEKNAAIGKTVPTATKETEKQTIAEAKESTTPTPALTNKQMADAEFEIYTVRKGDNLWEIAKRYPGVSAETIKSLNNIKNPRDLYIGQKLKIQPKG
jgi:membrane-bound lytic murein transglycosylase D